MNRVSRQAIVVALVALLLAGCSRAAARQPDPAVPPQSVAGVVKAEEGAQGKPEAARPSTISLAFVGDILLADRIGDLVAREGADAPWGDVAPVLRQADFAVGNLETSLGKGGVAQPGKKFTFQADPDTITGLTRAGVDAVSLGNNHILDYGPDGLAQTLERLDQAGVLHSGAGMNETAAYEAVIRQVNGVAVGFLSLSRVLPEGWAAGRNKPGVASAYNEAASLRLVTETAARCDVLVVAIHWGDENQQQPAAAVQRLAHKLVDAGADVVIGHHPHVWQGLSTYKGAVIAYSLGNFIFTTGSNPEGVETGVLELTVGRDGVHGGRIIPARIRWGRTEIAQPAEAAAFIKRISGMSDLPLDETGAFRLDPVGQPRTSFDG